VSLKGKSPINDEERRRAVIASLKPVDVAILGDESDFLKPVRAVSPDVVFLGYDQRLPPNLEAALRSMGIEVVKLDVKVEGVNTTSIREKLERAAT
jgi:FAD synthetase